MYVCVFVRLCVCIKHVCVTGRLIGYFQSVSELSS